MQVTDQGLRAKVTAQAVKDMKDDMRVAGGRFA